jgi:hypothetical protein
VLSSDSPYYREAYDGFVAEWGSSVPAVVLGVEPPSAPRPDAVVAFGSRAALRDWPGVPILETCLAPGAQSARRPGGLRVELLPEPARLIERMKRLIPNLRTLRVFWSSDQQSDEVSALAAAGAAAGVSVVSVRVRDPERLPARLRALTGAADALWLMPDPALVNAVNFSVLREYAAAQRVPFLAPTEGLAEKGATATLAAPFRDVGRAAAAALRERLARGPLAAGPARPGQIIVTLNTAAARAVGLSPSADAGVDRTVP